MDAAPLIEYSDGVSARMRRHRNPVHWNIDDQAPTRASELDTSAYIEQRVRSHYRCLCLNAAMGCRNGGGLDPLRYVRTAVFPGGDVC